MQGMRCGCRKHKAKGDGGSTIVTLFMSCFYGFARNVKNGVPNALLFTVMSAAHQGTQCFCQELGFAAFVCRLQREGHEAWVGLCKSRTSVLSTCAFCQEMKAEFDIQQRQWHSEEICLRFMELISFP